MSAKSVDSAIRELNKTVLHLQNKVTSLEKLILDQNKLIKKLVSDKANNLTEAKTAVIDAEEGNPSPQPTQRPMRDARIRAASAITAASRKAKAGGIISPAHSDNSTANAVDILKSTNPSASPTTSIVATTQLESDASNSTEHADRAGNNDDWTEVRRKRTRHTPTNVTRGTASPTSTSLLAAERKAYLHLYYVKSGTTVEQVIQHLHTICPDDECVAEVLKSRGDYASFKLSVPAKHSSKYLSPEHWAEDVHIKPWRSGFRNQKSEKK